MKQPDLILSAHPPSGRGSPGVPDVSALLPPRPRPWLDALARAPLVPVEFAVSTAWTGAVLEQLSYPGQPTLFLHVDGLIAELGTGLERALRLVHLSRRDAELLHGRRPFAFLGYDGPCCARFRFAPAGLPRSDAALHVLDSLREPR